MDSFNNFQQYRTKQRKILVKKANQYLLNLDKSFYTLFSNLNIGNDYEQSKQILIKNFCFSFHLELINDIFRIETVDWVMYENDETFIKEYFFKHFLALTTLATNPNNKIYHIKKALEDIELKEESEGWSQGNSSSQITIENKSYQTLSIKDPRFFIDKVQDESIANFIKNQQSKIEQLTEKLKFREDYLTKMTEGYHKDLQNLKNQLFKKDQGEMSDFYEVKYFKLGDVTDINVVNYKIENLKYQFEQRTVELYRQIDNQKQQIKEQQVEIHNYQKKLQYSDSPIYLIRKALQLEPHPYRFWKIMQDIKGNAYWFEIFEKQRPSFGIDYREINKLLMASKAYEREFQYYKDSIEQSMLLLTEQTIRKIKEYKEEAIYEVQNKKELAEDFEKRMEEFVEETKVKLNESITENEKIVKQQFQQEINHYESLFQNIDRFKIQYMFKIWKMNYEIYQYLERKGDSITFKDIQILFKSIFINSNHSNFKDDSIKQQIQIYKLQICEFQEQLHNRKMKILKLQSDNKFLEKQNERILALFKKYQSEYKKELNQSIEYKQRCSNLKGYISQLLQPLTNKFNQIQDYEAAFKDEKIILSFQEKLQKLNDKDLRKIKEMEEQSHKNEQIIEQYLSAPKKDQGTQTEQSEDYMDQLTQKIYQEKGLNQTVGTQTEMNQQDIINLQKFQNLAQEIEVKNSQRQSESIPQNKEKQEQEQKQQTQENDNQTEKSSRKNLKNQKDQECSRQVISYSCEEEPKYVRESPPKIIANKKRNLKPFVKLYQDDRIQATKLQQMRDDNLHSQREDWKIRLEDQMNIDDRTRYAQYFQEQFYESQLELLEKQNWEVNDFFKNPNGQKMKKLKQIINQEQHQEKQEIIDQCQKVSVEEKQRKEVIKKRQFETLNNQNKNQIVNTTQSTFYKETLERRILDNINQSIQNQQKKHKYYRQFRNRNISLDLDNYKTVNLAQFSNSLDVTNDVYFRNSERQFGTPFEEMKQKKKNTKQRFKKKFFNLLEQQKFEIS